uniref:Uncharacterized protein n=1 Tax=Arundo donax TaxID=35708 RepID=A0A0A8ZMJ2_ARUDO
MFLSPLLLVGLKGVFRVIEVVNWCRVTWLLTSSQKNVLFDESMLVDVVENSGL